MISVPESAKPRHVARSTRRWFVLGLILVALASGAIFVVIGYQFKQRQLQRELQFISQIRAVGGTVDTDRRWPEGMESIGHGTMRFVSRMRPVRIIDLSLARVDWSNPAAPRDVLSEVESFDLIELLWLNDCPQVNDASLSHVRNLRHLYSLFLDRTNITDAGLDHLRGLTRLTDVRLNKTAITDAGLGRLKHLEKLLFLHLDDTGVTDTGLEYLKGLSRLHEVSLNGTRTTVAGRTKLRKALPNCRILPQP